MNPISPRSVNYQIHGICFSPYLDKDPSAGTSVSLEKLSLCLDIIAPYCVWVRFYGNGLGLELGPKLAKSKGKKVAAACWISSDQKINEDEIIRLINTIQDGFVDIAIVGSEVLHRGELDEKELIGYIQRVKKTGITTTTDDTWFQLFDHPKVMEACDVVMANFYPYWEGISIDKAMQQVNKNYHELKTRADKKIIVGESGWPSDGETIHNAVPNLQNATYYFLNFVSWVRFLGIDYFYFEAFDEIWKAKYEGPQGAHWGIMDSIGRLKDGMMRVFGGELVEKNWD